MKEALCYVCNGGGKEIRRTAFSETPANSDEPCAYCNAYGFNCTSQFVICPYCASMYMQYELDVKPIKDKQIKHCVNETCGKEFEVYGEISVKYTTRKIE